VQKSAGGNSTIDSSHGLAQGLAQVRAEIARMPAGDRFEALRKMSVTDPAAMATFLDHLDAVAGKQRQLADSAGTLGNAHGPATRNAADATALWHQNISNLYDAVYSPALSTITGWPVDRTDAAHGASAAADHHSAIARYAALSLTALGGGVYYSLQELATFGTMTAFAGKGVQALGALALSVAAYEVYKHWDKFEPFFEHLWARVKGIFKSAAVEISKHWDAIRKVFSGAVNWLKTTGLNMMKSFGEGILAGAEYPFKAAWNLAKKVGGLFHFHSPPDYGPLREAVLNFRYGEELARHLTPAPIIAPARELAAGIAGAAPRGAAGSGSITINYSPQVIIQGAGSAKDEFVKALRQHADELVRIVRQKLAREARLSFT
jgi:hypothetical protein